VYADDENWNLHFKALVKYGEDHGGNCNMPKSYVCKLENGTEVRIGRWLDHQRQRRRKGTIRNDRLERIQALVDEGKLAWSMESVAVTDDVGWKQRYCLMLEYAESHGVGVCRIPWWQL